MAAVPKVLARSFPSSTVALTATVPTGYRWIITSVVITSQAGTSTSTGNVTLDGVYLANPPIGPGQQYVLDCRQVLDAGKVLALSTSVANTLHFQISGIEQGL